ncbi:hypothetical protein B0T24DRAFT_19661 [Lasiosphaeria ovina]|uniref:Secreted protein n=1 Tax=Lasiosphaeria ovina TaxID=92902 RepID=A0AAE0TX13_9PEZI|nr:hypothetical protein B0T24DRAFT_19661 [Lasiosphaeria ovina]
MGSMAIGWLCPLLVMIFGGRWLGESDDYIHRKKRSIGSTTETSRALKCTTDPHLKKGQAEWPSDPKRMRNRGYSFWHYIDTSLDEALVSVIRTTAM